MKYEIWLGGDSTHFDRGIVHFDDGQTAHLSAYCNVSIVRDSLIVGPRNEYGELDDKLRWYPYPGVIEFYMWDSELDSIIFHNSADYDVYILGYVYLKPGESVELDRRGEGIRTDYFARLEPFGLGRLVETDDEAATAFVGVYGLITQQRRFHPFEQIIRFASVPFLRGETEDTGLELKQCLYQYDDDGRLVAESGGHHYVFAYDKGDDSNE